MKDFEIEGDRNETFEEQLTHLLNRYSKENDSNTPDFILAEYMKSCLKIFNTAVQQRETWYGRDQRPPKTKDLQV